MKVTPISAFQDNYLWLIHDPKSHDCIIVDPGDAAPVLQFLAEHNLSLAAIFITHHHGDHTGGIAKILETFDVPVYGPDSANIPAVTSQVAEGSQIELFGKTFQVLEVPGHTLDHIAYYAAGDDEKNPPVLFCGDTLFAGGCGRVFEGTHPMMHQSLQKLTQLPPETRVYCAHEYTMANLRFAKAVSPESVKLENRIQLETGKRERNLPTVPTTLQLELQTNPFLRCHDAEIIASASQRSGQTLEKPDEVFAAIRSWKDSF